MYILEFAIMSLWVMLPALIPNNVAVLTSGGRPIDLNKKWNNKRLLGDGKTLYGTIGGLTAGILTGIILNILQPSMASITHISLIKLSPGVIISLSTGSMIGDIIGSFIKRRLRMKRGKSFPILDQNDFLIGSLIFVEIFSGDNIGHLLSLDGLIFLLVFTPLIHVFVNILAYKSGIKKEPW